MLFGLEVIDDDKTASYGSTSITIEPVQGVEAVGISVSCTTQSSTTVLVPGVTLGIQVGSKLNIEDTSFVLSSAQTVVSVIEDTSFVLSGRL